MSQADAYADAGYSPSRSSASDLRTKPNINARILELGAKAEKKTLKTVADIQDKAEQVIERCLQAEPVRDMQGRVVQGVYRFNAAGAVSAMKLIAHMRGYLVSVTVPLGNDLGARMEAARKRVVDARRAK